MAIRIELSSRQRKVDKMDELGLIGIAYYIKMVTTGYHLIF
jgi:hypothetical protein